MSRQAVNMWQRNMHSSNLPTTGFLVMLFIILSNNRFYWTHTGHKGLSISLTGKQVNRAQIKYFVRENIFQGIKDIVDTILS